MLVNSEEINTEEITLSKLQWDDLSSIASKDL